MRKTKEDTYNLLALPDMQCPYQDDRAVSAALSFASTRKWDECVIVGDFMDFSCISSFNRNAMRKIEGQTIADDYRAGNALLDRIQKAVRKVNRKAKIVLLEGNHEYRIERYIDEFPQLRDSIEVPKGLKLEERNVEWVPCWSRGDAYRVGKVYFHHGLYTNQHHAKKMVDNFGGCVAYGHTHDVQMFSKVLWGADKTVMGQSLGCLCRYDLDYVGKNPTNWQHAFGVFHFRKGGNFNHYVPRIMGGRFVGPDGKLYDGNV